jgi:hypothetical protein
LILRRPGLLPPKAKGRIQPTDHTVPYGTVPFWNAYQAVNCLATIIQPLRDKKPNFMSTASHQLTGPIDHDPKDEFFYVIHPLDDLPEEKVKSDHLPPLKMTRSVRWSLFTLRAYLIIMMLLLFYHVFDLARQVWR